MILLILGFVFFVILFLYIFIRIFFFRKGKIAKVVFTVVAILLALQVYWSVYPEDEFYISHLETYLDLKLSSDTKVLKKDASFPDQHGDFSLCVEILLNPSDFAKVTKKMEKIESSAKSSTGSCYVEKKFDRSKFDQIVFTENDENEYNEIGLSTSDRIVFYQFVSW